MAKAETHFIGRIAQKAIIVKEGKVLLVRSVGEKRFALPGGRLNEDETPQEGLVREVEEEIGCTVRLVRPFSTGTWVSPAGDPHFLVVYIAQLAGDAQLTLDADEIDEAVFVGRGEYEALDLYPEYRRIIDAFYEDTASQSLKNVV